MDNIRVISASERTVCLSAEAPLGGSHYIFATQKNRACEFWPGLIYEMVYRLSQDFDAIRQLCNKIVSVML